MTHMRVVCPVTKVPRNGLSSINENLVPDLEPLMSVIFKQ